MPSIFERGLLFAIVAIASSCASCAGAQSDRVLSRERLQAEYGLNCKNLSEKRWEQFLKDWQSDPSSCTMQSGTEITFASGVYTMKTTLMPVLVLHPIRSERTKSPLVFVVGGPGDIFLSDIPLSPYDEFVKNIVKSGHPVVFLGYSGTYYRKQITFGEITTAATEVSSYVERLKKLSVEADVRMIGLSAGAIVTYLAMRETPRTRAVLFSPPIISPEQSILNQVDTVRLNKREIGSPSSKSKDLEAAEKQLRYSQVFFGLSFSLSLSDLLKKLPIEQSRFRIIIGSRDDRVGLEQLPVFKRDFPAVDVTVVDGLQHGMQTEDDARRASDALIKVLER